MWLVTAIQDGTNMSHLFSLKLIIIKDQPCNSTLGTVTHITDYFFPSAHQRISIVILLYLMEFAKLGNLLMPSSDPTSATTC